MIEHRDGRGKPKYWKIRPFIAISIQQSKPRSVREAVTEGFVLALLDSAWPSSGHDLLSHPTGLVPVLVQRAHGAAITSTGRVTNDSYTDGNFIHYPLVRPFPLYRRGDLPMGVFILLLDPRYTSDRRIRALEYCRCTN